MLTTSTSYARNVDAVNTLCEDNIVTRRKRKTAYHHGNLRAALIACGLELIEEMGVPALTLREIGKRLNVSRSAAYRHFKDKAALLSAISEAGFIDFVNVQEQAKKGAPSGFAAQIEALGVAYVRFANEHRAHFEVMFTHPPDPGCEAAQVGARAFGILVQTVREGQQQGEVREGDPVLLARVLWSLVHGASMLRLDGDNSDAPFMRFSTDVVRSGLHAQTPAVVSPSVMPASDPPSRPDRPAAPPIASPPQSPLRSHLRK